jgi:hypothetical protein
MIIVNITCLHKVGALEDAWNILIKTVFDIITVVSTGAALGIRASCKLAFIFPLI